MRIEEILLTRKNYSSKVYEYFNIIKETVVPYLEEIVHLVEEIKNEEEVIFNKISSNKKKLSQFEKETSKILSKKMLDAKRMAETNSIRNKLEGVVASNQKNYLKLMEYTKEKEKNWKERIKILALKNFKEQSILNEIGNKLDQEFPKLHKYCSEWRNEPLSTIKDMINEDDKIIKKSKLILELIEKYEKTLQYDHEEAENIYTSITIESVNLSKVLESFLVNESFIDALTKLQQSYPFIENFFIAFKDTSFSSLRTSIKMVASLEATKQKINIILSNFYYIDEVAEDTIKKIENKKKELMVSCITKEELVNNILDKWIINNFSNEVCLVNYFEKLRNEYKI